MNRAASTRGGATTSLAVDAARSSLWSLAGQLAQSVIGLASFAVLSHFLAPADYGLLAMAATVQGFLGVLGDTGMVAAVVRAPALDERIEATAFWVALAGAALLTAFSAMAAPVLGWFYREPAVVPLALALAATFLVAAPARVSTAKLTRSLDFRALTLISVVSNLGALVAAWALARSGGGAWALVAQQGISFALQTLLSLVAAPVTIRMQLVSGRTARDLAGFSSRMSGFSLAATAARAADPVLAGRFLGLEAVGLMSMGIKLVVVPMQRISSAVSTVFLPTMLKLDDQRHGEAFRTALRLTSLATIPLSLGVCAIAPEIAALLPSRWAALTAPLRLYALGTLVEPLGWYALAAATARGRTEPLLRTGVALIPIGWGGAFAGALSGRVEWMVTAWAVVNAIGALLILAIIWREFRLDRRLWRAFVVPLGLGAVMVLVVRITLWLARLSDQRLGALVGVAAGAAVYGLLVLAFEGADARRLLDLVGRVSGAVRRSG